MATDELPIDQPARYRLNDVQRALVRGCLNKAEISLPQDRFKRLVGDLETSIDHFRNTPLEGTYREAHDALRALWKRCYLDEPPVRVLRDELRKLPKAAVASVARRARVVIPRLFPGETIEDDVSDSPDRLAARFLVWAASADDQKLVEALRVLSADGGRGVAGRSRGGGKRSRARFEPVIIGEVRGVGTRDHTGGRPAEAARHELVMHLAVDWLTATGQAPEAGRSDSIGFGDLVHSVFQWLDVSADTSEAASYALRRFWDIKTPAAPFIVPLVCADCRWVRQGEGRDALLCDKLALACATAREVGQKCGPEGLLFEQAA